jgi:hypothetical protein
VDDGHFEAGDRLPCCCSRRPLKKWAWGAGRLAAVELQ